MRYLDIRNSVLEQVRKYFADRKLKINVEAAAGSLNNEEIGRLFIKAPSVYLSIARIDIEKELIRFVCYIVVRANQKDKIYDSGLELTGALISCIKNIDTLTYGYDAENIIADCLYSGELDKINACLWGLSFDLNIRSTNIDCEINDISALENFEGYDAEHKLEEESAYDSVSLEDTYAIGGQ